MRREDRFLISHAPYAVEPGSFDVRETWATYTNPDGTSRRGDRPYYSVTVNAAWFRRKSGVLVACMGKLWDTERARPADWQAWLESFTDGRYGGNCQARYDGNNLWSPETGWEEAKRRQVFLSRMLDNFPAAPEGFSGWYTFHA